MLNEVVVLCVYKRKKKMRSIVFLLIFFISAANSQFEGDSCARKHDNAPGICRNARSCPRVREDYRYGIPLTVCAYLSGQVIVCCPDSSSSAAPITPSSWDQQPTQSNVDSTRKRISVRECEKYAKMTKETILVNSLTLLSSNHEISISKCDITTPLIVGGQVTKPGEYPHMAAIGWRSLDGTIDFKCGGSLISERFVLTAAHCGRADGLTPSVVRLGDQNLRTRSDGVIEVDYQVAEFIRHEQYRRRSYYFDIAVIKLSRNVAFTKYIRPACLWQTFSINHTSAIATGWGYTEVGGGFSDELMKVKLDIIDNQSCNQYVESSKLDRGIIDSQLCAGVLAGGMDTCNGDSGGPVQVTNANKCLYHILGVTSFGSPFCGSANIPGVYTRVSSYIDWIEGKVWG